MTDVSTPGPHSADGAARKATAVATPLVMALIFCVAFAAKVGWPAWPVIDAAERIPYSAIAAAVIATAVAFIARDGLRLLVNALAIGACAVPTLLPMVRPTDWSYGAFALIAGALIAVVALLATATQRLAQADRTPLVSLVLLGMCASAGGLLMSTGSLKLGEAGFGLAAAMALVTIVRLFEPRSDLAILSASTFVYAVLAGLLASGRLWSALPIYYAIPVLLAAVIAWVVRIPAVARWPAWRRVVVGLLLAAAPATVVTAIAAVRAYQEAQQNYYEGYSY